MKPPPVPDAPEDALAWMSDLAQLLRICLEMRLCFQDHVILIDLGIHGVDLALAKLSYRVLSMVAGAIPAAMRHFDGQVTASLPVC